MEQQANISEMLQVIMDSSQTPVQEMDILGFRTKEYRTFAIPSSGLIDSIIESFTGYGYFVDFLKDHSTELLLVSWDSRVLATAGSVPVLQDKLVSPCAWCWSKTAQCKECARIVMYRNLRRKERLGRDLKTLSRDSD